MIDFRYHIVSLVAVFLALTLGILLGSSVIQGAVVDRLRDDITRYRTDRDEARGELRELRESSERRSRLLTDEIAPWSLDGRLEGGRIVLVTDGPQAPEWASHVEGALTRAGATLAGTISLTDRWGLASVADREALTRALGTPEGTRTDAATALRTLGTSFLAPSGRVLIDALVEERFLQVEGRPDEGAWPPPSAQVVVLAPSRRAELGPTPGSVDLATSLGTVAPTLVVTDRPEGRSLVTDIRRLRAEEDIGGGLSTFDSSTAASDPGGVGVVAALISAGEDRGGDFGVEGSSFVAPLPAARG